MENQPPSDSFNEFGYRKKQRPPRPGDDSRPFRKPYGGGGFRKPYGPRPDRGPAGDRGFRKPHGPRKPYGDGTRPVWKKKKPEGDGPARESGGEPQA